MGRCRGLIYKHLNPDRDRRIGHRGAGEGEEGKDEGAKPIPWQNPVWY